MYSFPDGLSNCVMFPFFVTQYLMNLLPVLAEKLNKQVTVASKLGMMYCCLASMAACRAAESCARAT
jgi:hypothetical protein